MKWAEVSLGDIISIKGGGTPSRKDSSYWDGSIPWASVKDFVSTELKETQESITENGLKKSSSNLIPANNIIIPTRMALGKVAINTIPLAINQDLKALFINNYNSVDTRYLAYFLRSKSSYIKRNGSGATVKGVTLDFIKKIPVPLPPLETQKQIVDLLDRAQALIDKREEQIALMDQLIQSLFYDMFGDPVTNPLGWEKKILQENVVGKYGIKAGPFGSALKKVDYVTSGIRVYGQEQVIAGRFDIGDYYIDFNKFKKLKSCEVKQDDILVSLVGSFGKVLIVPDNIEKGIINPRLLKITLNQSVLVPRFFVEMFRLPMTQLSLAALSHGGTMGILNAGILKKMKTILPPISLQNSFAERVQKIEAQKEAMSASLQELENNFNSIMQRAFKGEL